MSRQPWSLSLIVLCILTAVALPAYAAMDKLDVRVSPGDVSAAPPVTATLTASVKDHSDPKAGGPTPTYTYSWDLDGDGNPESTGPTVEVTVAEVGKVVARVTVVDDQNRVGHSEVWVVGLTAMQVQERNGYSATVILLIVSSIVFFIFFLANANPILGKVGLVTYGLGFLALIYSNLFRALNLGEDMRLPNIHLYEVLQFFAIFALGWCLWASLRFKDSRPVAYCATFVAMVLLYIANFPTSLKDPGTVQPALQSYWRNIHVTAIILSYGGITAAFFASLSYFFRPSKLADHMAYKSTLFAYPLLTAGIIMGGLWANESWGTYWSWDPKETASLVIWLVLTAYLHTRMILGWSGVPSAALSALGFASMVFCFVGLNFMPGNSLHKYAGTGMTISTAALTGALVYFFTFIWSSHRPWALAAEDAAALAAEDISEAGVDSLGKSVILPKGAVPMDPAE